MGMPDAATIYQDLTWGPTQQEMSFLLGTKDFKGMDFTWRPRDTPSDWSAFLMDWPTWTAHNWQIPLVSVALYFMTIPTLRWMVAKYGKWNVRNVAFYWNAFLSIFSWCGVFACVPVMVDQFLRHGLHFTCCAPAMWYGGGLCGFFVGLFIYSKVAEFSLRTDLGAWPGHHPPFAWRGMPRIHLDRKGLTEPVSSLTRTLVRVK